MKTLKKNGIYELHLEVTGKCNLNCVYCYNYDCRIKKDMSFEKIKCLIKEAKTYGTKKFTFTGGEPFMRKDFFKIVKEVGEGGYVAILSNGKVIDKKMVEKIKKYPQIKEFKISWDGFSSHNKMRVGSKWEETVKTINLLKQNKFRVVINTIVLEPNQKDLYKLYKYLIRLKVDRWRVDMPFNLGNYIKNNKKFLPPTPKYYTKMFAKIIGEHELSKSKMIFEVFNLYKSEFKPTNTITFNPNVHPCEYKRELLSIKPNGDVVFCPSLSFVMSNYGRANNLDEVFKEEMKHPFYNLKMSDLKNCNGCRYLLICGGGCRANAIYDFNDYAGRDISACMTFPFWEKEILPILKKSHQRFFRKNLNTQGFIPSESIINMRGKK